MTEPSAAPLAPSVRDSVLRQLGGLPGLIESSVPVAVFVVVNILTDLRTALWAAVGSAALVAGVRLLRRQPARYAVNGLIGVVVAALIAGKTGRAENFYLLGILSSLGYGAAFLFSVLLRWPLVGVLLAFLEGAGSDWRRDSRLLRGYSLLSLLWAGVFLVRAGVWGTFYLLHRPDSLGVSRLALGLPLFGPALLVTVWYARRVHRTSGSANAATPAGQETAQPAGEAAQPAGGPDTMS